MMLRASAASSIHSELFAKYCHRRSTTPAPAIKAVTVETEMPARTEPASAKRARCARRLAIRFPPAGTVQQTGDSDAEQHHAGRFGHIGKRAEVGEVIAAAADRRIRRRRSRIVEYVQQRIGEDTRRPVSLEDRVASV